MWYFDLLLKVTFVNIKDWTYQYNCTYILSKSYINLRFEYYYKLNTLGLNFKDIHLQVQHSFDF